MQQRQLIAAWPNILSVKQLAVGMFAAMLLTGAIIVGVAWRSHDLSLRTDAAWTEIHAEVNDRVRATTMLIELLGYDGFVHSYKNLLLRKDPALINEIYKKIGGAQEALHHLRRVSNTEESRAAIVAMQDILDGHLPRLEKIRALISVGANAAEMDAIAGIEDLALDEAFVALVEFAGRDEDGDHAHPSKGAALLELKAALGYRGMIHGFKNYVLRGDLLARDRMLTSSAAARRALDEYRLFGISQAESDAIDSIDAMIDAYRSRIDIIDDMIEKDARKEEIDAAVRVDDGPARRAFETLDLVLAERRLSLEAGLGRNIAETERLSLWSMVVAALISALLATGVFVTLIFGVVKPAERISRGLTQVARGDTDVDLSAFESNTELGLIATAAEVFRHRSDELLDLREQMLSDSESRSNAIIEAAFSAVFSTDVDGGIESVNAAALRMFRVDANLVIGMNLSRFLEVEADAETDSSFEAYRAVTPSDGSELDIEVSARRIDDTTFPANLTMTKVKLHDRTIYGAIIRDLTAIKDAERIKKAEQMKSEFVATVSHELRTPLTSIKGSLGLLKSSILGELPEQANNMLEIAYSNCDRLVRLINDILDIEKIEAGKLHFAFEAVVVGPEIDRVIADTASFAAGREVTVAKGENADDVSVEADPDRLAQVLTNLVSNAIKFSPRGETVTIDVTAVDNDVRIAVVDRGPGVSEEFQAQIFQKFAQEETGDARRAGGTGLGLSISKAIVEVHGGTIGFETEPGAGATFWITLPQLVEPTAAFADSAPPKVLICEDDPDIGTLLQVLVRDMGFDAEVCRTAEAAKESLRAKDFVAMTLDIGMPDQDGKSLICDLRDDPRTRDLPVIVVSAGERRSDAELEGDAFRVVDWLSKPIDPDRLKSALGRAIRVVGAGDAARILQVEDDPEHVRIIGEIIDDGCICDVARTCAEARALLARHDYDLVILDLLLDDGDGRSLLPAIEANGETPPQVMVFSISETPADLRSRVDAALIKSRTSNTRLREKLEALLKARCKRREIELFA